METILLTSAETIIKVKLYAVLPGGISFQVQLNTVTANLATESNTRAIADENLQNQITDLDTGLSQESTTRANADTNLQNQITDLDTGLSQEVTTRASADSNLQTQINNEVNNRTNADTNLQNQINGISGILIDGVLGFLDQAQAFVDYSNANGFTGELTVFAIAKEISEL